MDVCSTFLPLAQTVTINGAASGAPIAREWMILAIVGGALGMVLTIVWWGLRHARMERELEHAERMKALEVGILLPKDQAFWNPARVAVAIGAGVPLGVFVLAVSASLKGAEGANLWPAACGIGTIAVIGGTVLAARLKTEKGIGASSIPVHGKPAMDSADRELSEHFV